MQVVRYLHNKTPLLCIFAGETAKLAFFFELKKNAPTANLFESMIMILSLFCIPAIGLLSDKHCRKKTLLITISLGLLALVAVVRDGFVGSFLQGVIGAAVVPIARAMHLDIKADPNREWKVSMAAVETVMVQSIAWSCLSLYVSIDFADVSMLLFLICLGLLIPLKDKRDKDIHVIKNEASSVRKRYLQGYSWQILIAFFLYDCAFQLPNYYSEAFASHESFTKVLSLVGSGILLGSIIIWLLIVIFHNKLSSGIFIREALHKGLLVTSAGMLLVYFLPFLQSRFKNTVQVDEKMFFYFCCISGMFLSLVFVYYANISRTHERGLLFSILEEVETFAETVVPLLIFYLPQKQMLTNIPFIIIIGLGSLCLFNRPSYFRKSVTN